MFHYTLGNKLVLARLHQSHCTTPLHRWFQEPTVKRNWYIVVGVWALVFLGIGKCNFLFTSYSFSRVWPVNDSLPGYPLVSCPDPREEKGSGVTSPNPWASSRSVERPTDPRTVFIRIMRKQEQVLQSHCSKCCYGIHFSH